MRTRVKICGITVPEHGAAAAMAGADAVGLVFYDPSPRAVSLERAVEIAAALPALCTTVALFVNPTEQKLEHVLRSLPVDLIQFQGEETPEFCRRWGRPYVKAIKVTADTDVELEAGRYSDAKAWLLDAYHPAKPGGTGETFDWTLVPRQLSHRVILAGGLKVENVGRAIAAVAPYGVDVSGGVESSPGVKDPVLIDAFIREVNGVTTT